MNDLTNLEPKQQRFIHLYSTGNYTQKEIADLLEVSKRTISRWLRSSDVQEALDNFQQNTHKAVQTGLTALTMKAIERLHKLMDSPVDGVAYQAVRDVLDRAGHKATQKVEKNVTVKTIEEKMKDLIEDTIDVDYEEVEE